MDGSREGCMGKWVDILMYACTGRGELIGTILIIAQPQGQTGFQRLPIVTSCFLEHPLLPSPIKGGRCSFAWYISILLLLVWRVIMLHLTRSRLLSVWNENGFVVERVPSTPSSCRQTVHLVARNVWGSSASFPLFRKRQLSYEVLFQSRRKQVLSTQEKGSFALTA